MKDNQLLNGSLIFFLVIIGGLIFSAFIKSHNGYKVNNISLYNQVVDDGFIINYYDFLENHYLHNEDDDILILDIRNADLYSLDHIKNAVNIPLPLLFDKSSIKQIKKHKGKIIIYSDNEHNSVIATLLLQSMGLNKTFALAGDFNTFKSNIIDNLDKSFLFYNSEKIRWNYPNIIKSKVTVPETQVATPEPIIIQGGC